MICMFQMQMQSVLLLIIIIIFFDSLFYFQARFLFVKTY